MPHEPKESVGTTPTLLVQLQQPQYPQKNKEGTVTAESAELANSAPLAGEGQRKDTHTGPDGIKKTERQRSADGQGVQNKSFIA